jgi:hemin uptake protein HemP
MPTERDTEINAKQTASTHAVAPAGAASRREVESTTLLAGGREVLIRHGGETYTLRQTSKGKLILTK